MLLVCICACVHVAMVRDIVGNSRKSTSIIAFSGKNRGENPRNLQKIRKGVINDGASVVFVYTDLCGGELSLKKVCNEEDGVGVSHGLLHKSHHALLRT